MQHGSRLVMPAPCSRGKAWRLPATSRLTIVRKSLRVMSTKPRRRRSKAIMASDSDGGTGPFGPSGPCGPSSGAAGPAGGSGRGPPGVGTGPLGSGMWKAWSGVGPPAGFAGCVRRRRAAATEQIAAASAAAAAPAMSAAAMVAGRWGRRLHCRGRLDRLDPRDPQADSQSDLPSAAAVAIARKACPAQEREREREAGFGGQTTQTLCSHWVHCER